MGLPASTRARPWHASRRAALQTADPPYRRQHLDDRIGSGPDAVRHRGTAGRSAPPRPSGCTSRSSSRGPDRRRAVHRAPARRSEGAREVRGRNADGLLMPGRRRRRFAHESPHQLLGDHHFRGQKGRMVSPAWRRHARFRRHGRRRRTAVKRECRARLGVSLRPHSTSRFPTGRAAVAKLPSATVTDPRRRAPRTLRRSPTGRPSTVWRAHGCSRARRPDRWSHSQFCLRRCNAVPRRPESHAIPDRPEGAERREQRYVGIERHARRLGVPGS